VPSWEGEHLAQRIPWLRISSEAVAIVVSILLAFGIQAWWEERQERLEEQEILLGLKADFEANLASIDALFAVHHDWDIVIGDALSGRQTSVPPDSASTYSTAITARRTFSPRDATLDAVIASGRIEIISDRGLREQLVSWTRGVDDLGEEGTSYWTASENVIARVTELGGPWNTLISSGPIARVPQLQEEAATFPPPDFDVVLNDPELLGLLRAKRFWSLFYRAALAPLVATAEQIVGLIDSNLS